MLDANNPVIAEIISRKIAKGELKQEQIKTQDPDLELMANIEAATTLEELKAALLGKSGKVKIKGEYK